MINAERAVRDLFLLGASAGGIAPGTMSATSATFSRTVRLAIRL